MENRTFFSDETKYYRMPAQPDPGDTVHIRFRTGRYQATAVFLCSESEEHQMSWESYRNDFDYYYDDITVCEETFFYFFRAELPDGCIYYGRNGVCGTAQEAVPFSVIPGFHTPDWAAGCLYYQIFPDRFYNGCPSFDVTDSNYLYGGKPVLSSKWGDPVSFHTFRQFYGGDLKGIKGKLSYLADLGIEAIYLNPVFASPSSHKYDCCDYEHVDYGLGSSYQDDQADRSLADLIGAAHEFGIKVVLDGVFNHCSSCHKWFDKSGRFKKGRKLAGAYANPKSRYHDRFIFFDDACEDYEAWWDVPSLPKLNYEGDPSLEEEILSVAKKWISPPYNADGWRVDVAADLGHSREYNHRFWNHFRTAIRSEKQDALIIAEHYEDPSPWLNGKEWDGIMNYCAFMDPVSYFFTGMEKHSDAYIPELEGNAEWFAGCITEQTALLPQSSLLCSLIQLDNHDHSRFLTRTNKKCGRIEELGPESASADVQKSVLFQAAGFLYFWAGAPGLYYGDEAGVCGFTDPDNRRCYPWGSEDQEILTFFRELGQLRKNFAFIKDASCRILYAENSVVCFSRFTDEKSLFIAVSAAEESREVCLPLWIAGLPGYEKNRFLSCVAASSTKGYSFEQKPFVAHYGILEITLPPKALLILFTE